MTRTLVALALLMGLSTSCAAATLSVHGTAPDSVSEGSCQYARSYPASAPMWVFGRVEGTALLDSLWRNPGDPFGFRWSVAPGTWRVVAWARNNGGVSCSSSVSVEAVSRPAPVRVGP